MFFIDNDDGRLGSIRLALQNYFQIASNEKPSRVKTSSSIPAEYLQDLDSLWNEHDKIRSEYHQKYLEISWEEIEQPEFSYFDLKLEISDKILGCCSLCEKNCRINRRIENGFCNVNKPHISSEFLHMGEEPPLVPSHTIFFSGCNFKCVYCQNWDISQYPDRGMVLEPEKLAKIIDLRRRQGSMKRKFRGWRSNTQLTIHSHDYEKFYGKHTCGLEQQLVSIGTCNEITRWICRLVSHRF